MIAPNPLVSAKNAVLTFAKLLYKDVWWELIVFMCDAMSSRQSSGPEEGFEDPPAAFAEFAAVVEPLLPLLLVLSLLMLFGVAVDDVPAFVVVVPVSGHISFVGFDTAALLL